VKHIFGAQIKFSVKPGGKKTVAYFPKRMEGTFFKASKKK
jgi:hypothetical protein